MLWDLRSFLVAIRPVGIAVAVGSKLIRSSYASCSNLCGRVIRVGWHVWTCLCENSGYLLLRSIGYFYSWLVYRFSLSRGQMSHSLHLPGYADCSSGSLSFR